MGGLFGSSGSGGGSTAIMPKAAQREYGMWIGQEADDMGVKGLGHQGGYTASGTDEPIWVTMKTAMAAPTYTKTHTDPKTGANPIVELIAGIDAYQTAVNTYAELVEWSAAWANVSTDLLTPTTGILAVHTLSDLDFATLMDTLITATSADLDTMSSSRVTASNYSLAVADMVTKAVAQVDTCSVLKNVDLEALINATRTGVLSLIEDAVTSAINAVDDTVIAGAVTAFNNSSKAARAVEIRKFSGQMADINAVHGSAFLIGTALIHRQHLEDTDTFEAGLRMTTYNMALEGHLEMFKNNLGAKLAAELQNKSQRNAMIQFDIESQKEIYTAEIVNYMQQISQGFADKVMRDKSNWDFETAVFRENTNNTFAQSMQLLSHQQQLASMIHTFESARFVMDNEYVDAFNEREYKEAMYDLEVWAQGATILGIPTGMTGIAARGIGKGQSALSGAAAGAKIGAAFTPVGALVGAGIGAALGGLFG